MKYLHLLWAGLRRRPLRTLFTFLSTFFAFLLFGLLAATRMAFDGGIEVADAERLLVISKVGFLDVLPVSYGRRIEAVEGVETISGSWWFGGYHKEKRNAFPQFTADESYLDMYPELIIDAAEREAWLKDRDGALIGEALANRFGWKVGDRIPIISPIHQRKDGGHAWEFDISGIMRAGKKGVDTTYMLFHNDYLEEGRAFGQGTMGWYVVKIADTSMSAQVIGVIDGMFANSPTETKTLPEDAFVQEFVGQVGDIGKIFTGIVAVVLFTLFMVTANTMAQGVRERTSELAVMNVLGYSRRKLAGLILAEAVLLVLLGGGLAIAAALPLVAWIAGDPQIGGFFPAFYLSGKYIAIAFGLMLMLGLLSGLIPSVRALTMRNADGLRRLV